MNEYLALYLVLGLPASVTVAIFFPLRPMAYPLVYTLWPFWLVLVIVRAILPDKPVPCSYCGLILPPDDAVIMEHVQQCEANPLVQRVLELETQLSGCLDTIIPHVAEVDKIVRGGENDKE